MRPRSRAASVTVYEVTTLSFRDIKTLQTFTSVHASLHHHFNHQRHLNRRDIFK